MHDYTDPAAPQRQEDPAAAPPGDDALARFVRAQTQRAAPPLVPEIALRLATAVTPLWHATETTLAVNGLDPPYWAFAWPGGQALARHVLDHPELVRGQRVLDFAAGSGIAAIAAARAGAAACTASELDRFACTAIALNARENGVDVRIVAADLTQAVDPGWDTILAGDVCYERPMAERAFAWLCAQAREGTIILLADPGRAYLPPGLAEIARYVVPTSRDLEDREERVTRVFRLDQAALSSTIR